MTRSQKWALRGSGYDEQFFEGCISIWSDLTGRRLCAGTDPDSFRREKTITGTHRRCTLSAATTMRCELWCLSLEREVLGLCIALVRIPEPFDGNAHRLNLRINYCCLLQHRPISPQQQADPHSYKLLTAQLQYELCIASYTSALGASHTAHEVRPVL